MVRCTVCGMEVDSIEQAIQENWVPGFWEYDQEHGPACAFCSEKLLVLAEDGEFELRQEYRGKLIYKEEPQREDLECEDCQVEDVLLGFILN
ncbi:MAG: hypothetical protein ACLFUP_10305 [Desulfobacteraceae bacterium]